ncbi:MAG: methyltransferase domain-containing protein [Mycobacteriales bacterium]|nr:class I SAM-dependent methyltransferase [Frankia sp.]
MSEFIDVPLRPATLDRWLVRNRIVDALRKTLPSVNGVVLDVGCGKQPYRSLLLAPPSCATAVFGVDIPSERYGKHDVAWDGLQLPFGDSSVDYVLATEVLEHCAVPDVVVAEMFRVLRPGGGMFLTVPFLWPLHDTPYDEYRYTPYALERILVGAGFDDVALEALGGWDASLAQLIGLWVRRRPMRATTRRILSRAALPVVRALVRRDRMPASFADGVMMTGLAGTAAKPATRAAASP